MRIVTIDVVKFAISSRYQCCSNILGSSSYHRQIQISCALLQNLPLLASHNFGHLWCVLNLIPPFGMTNCA
jgi:hypothetical protein